MPVTSSVDTSGVATLLLDRAAKRNALDGAMLESLLGEVCSLATAEIRCVVVRGAGGTFCAGADIADWVAPAGPDAAALSKLGRDAFSALAALPVPSIAVIEGTAVGGGFELALACDVRVATEGALIGFPELALGNLPAWGGLTRLIDAAGLGVARHLLLTGELVTGERAAALGAVTSVAAEGHLDSLVAAIVQRFVSSDPSAVAIAKALLSQYGTTNSPLEPTLAAYTAGLDSSRSRKQDFMDRKAAARAARASTAV